MVEELIIKSLISGGVGAAGGALTAFFYLRERLTRVETEIKQIKKDREEENAEIKEMNGKLDKVLEYMSFFRMLESKLRIGELNN